MLDYFGGYIEDELEGLLKGKICCEVIVMGWVVRDASKN